MNIYTELSVLSYSTGQHIYIYNIYIYICIVGPMREKTEIFLNEQVHRGFIVKLFISLRLMCSLHFTVFRKQ